MALLAPLLALAIFFGAPSGVAQAQVPSDGYGLISDLCPNYPFNTKFVMSNYWKDSSHTVQRYHFKLSWSDGDWATSWHRPYSLEIDGIKFGDFHSSRRSGTLYDGFINFSDNKQHTFQPFWKMQGGGVFQCSLKNDFVFVM